MTDALGESKLKENDSVRQSIEPESDTHDIPIMHKKSSSLSSSHTRSQSIDMVGTSSTSAISDAEAAGPSQPHTISLSKSAYKTPANSDTSDVSNNDVQDLPKIQISGNTSTTPLPSIDEQVNTVMSMMQRPLEEGDRGYVISQTWLGRVLSRGTNKALEQRFGKEAQEGPVGPVDNKDLGLVTDSSMPSLKDEAGEVFVPLRPGLSELEDFQILPKEAWDLVMQWYGNAEGSPVFLRYCHDTTGNKNNPNYQYELYPPIFTILKLPDRSGGMTQSSLRETNAPPVQLLGSSHMNFQLFLRRAKECANVPSATKVRLWRILGGLDSVVEGGMITPAESRSNSPSPKAPTAVNPGKRLALDTSEFLKLEEGTQRERINVGDNTANPKFNGSATLNTVGFGADSVLLLEEQVGGPAGGEFTSDLAQRQEEEHGVQSGTAKSGILHAQELLKAKATNSGRTSPASGGSAMMTRGRAAGGRRGKGTVGLSNLGNTCYMNSALQCVRSVEELTEYFLRNKYKSELNPKNPLSHGGNVAKAYASLLHEMYIASSTSFSPRQFKNTIGRYGASFSGYAQQDSQEFLLFLLDGLQEDLNRIHNKPYVEYKDSTDEMVHNPDALKELADDRWTKYKLRNDSVITDLFAGMYKSTVTCPECDKVSIIFDPFNNLTLQIPIESCWTGTIHFFPLRSRPVCIDVDINKNATFWQLKEYIGRKTGVAPQNLIMSEIYTERFYKMFDDKMSISEAKILVKDVVAMYEVEEQPTNFPPPKRKKKSIFAYGTTDTEDEDIANADPSLSDKLLVPVFMRKPQQENPNQKRLFGAPFYTVIDREEAKDYDAILRKILAKVDTLTTRDFLRENEEASADDSDTALMTHEEATSSASSGVATQSVESDMVDISMREDHDASERSRGPSSISYPPTNSKSTSLPRMLRPGEFINPEVRELFEMKYFTSTEEIIPTGWNHIQESSQNFATLRSREPQTPTMRHPRKINLKQRIRDGGTPPSSDEDEEEHDVPELEPDNPEDSDDGLPPVERLTQPGAFSVFGRSNQSAVRPKKGLITYSRKGKSVAREGGGGPVDENPSLIRLGEAIILEWPSHGFDALFGKGDDPDDKFRGANTWDDIPLLDDPAMREKRAQREKRAREGVSLDDCLDEFGKAEVLSESEAWFCPRCKEHRQASKRFQIWKSPDILIIHLKRFTTQGRLRDKLDALVNFPIESLDLSERVLAPEKDESLVYDLFAVDNHYGGLGGGHYTAFAKNSSDDMWYQYDGEYPFHRNALL